MKAQALVEKMQLQEERDWLHKQQQDRKRKAMQPKKPQSRAAANIAKVTQLRHQTAKMRFELESNKQLAAATKSHQDASVALYLANLTPAQQAERDEDTRRMAVYYSSLCPELSFAWREEAAATFRNRKV